MSNVFQKSRRGFKSLLSRDSFANVDDISKNMRDAQRRICRVYIESVPPIVGTGILIDTDVILTNFHVVEDVILGNIDATKVSVRFDLNDLSTPSREYRLGSPHLIGSAKTEPVNLDGTLRTPTKDEMDFALLRIHGVPAKDSVGSNERGHFSLEHHFKVLNDGILHAMHFPGGARTLKQSSGHLTETQITRRIRYTTNTLPGSSGGLILNSSFLPVAIHHVGYEKRDDEGLIIKDECFNQGILLSDIHDFLKRKEIWSASRRADDRPPRGTIKPIQIFKIFFVLFVFSLMGWIIFVWVNFPKF